MEGSYRMNRPLGDREAMGAVIEQLFGDEAPPAFHVNVSADSYIEATVPKVPASHELALKAQALGKVRLLTSDDGELLVRLERPALTRAKYWARWGMYGLVGTIAFSALIGTRIPLPLATVLTFYWQYAYTTLSQ